MAVRQDDALDPPRAKMLTGVKEAACGALAAIAKAERAAAVVVLTIVEEETAKLFGKEIFKMRCSHCQSNFNFGCDGSCQRKASLGGPRWCSWFSSIFDFADSFVSPIYFLKTLLLWTPTESVAGAPSWWFQLFQNPERTLFFLVTTIVLAVK